MLLRSSCLDPNTKHNEHRHRGHAGGGGREGLIISNFFFSFIQRWQGVCRWQAVHVSKDRSLFGVETRHGEGQELSRGSKTGDDWNSRTQRQGVSYTKKKGTLMEQY